MPSKRIIILERASARNFRAAMWFDVPATRQAFYANPGLKSQWISASTAENDALASGAVVEQVDSFNYPNLTGAQIQTALEDTWTARQADINAYNPWNMYGRFWQGDGSGWIAGGVL